MPDGVGDGGWTGVEDFFCGDFASPGVEGRGGSDAGVEGRDDSCDADFADLLSCCTRAFDGRDSVATGRVCLLPPRRLWRETGIVEGEERLEEIVVDEAGAVVLCPQAAARGSPAGNVHK